MKEIAKMYERQAKLLEFMEKNPNKTFVPKTISQKYKDKKVIEQKAIQHFEVDAFKTYQFTDCECLNKLKKSQGDYYNKI